MFDVSFSELLAIGVVALLVIGPERLPKVARTAGVLLARLQRYVGTVKADIHREMQLDELRRLQQEVQDSARNMEQSVQQQLAAVEGSVKQTLVEAESAAGTANAAQDVGREPLVQPQAAAFPTPSVPEETTAVAGATPLPK
ncbi:MAG: Sec-independent protein translocase protein TatB [Rhodocyclaceae bacterium]